MSVSVAAILGIDYGQQFTKAIMLAPGVNFEILLTEEARRKDLSGVSIRSSQGDDLERIYGSAAQSLCTRFPQNCITDIKPLLGKSFYDREVSDYLTSHFGLKLIEDPDRANAIKFDLGFTNQSYTFSVEEVLAMTLKELRSRALDALDENPVAKSIVDDVAISVPPFITQQQRQAYLDAVNIAGYKNLLGLVDEGTAVAVNFMSSKKYEQKEHDDKKRYYMIYDLGAGSTKATLFSITPFANMSTVLEFENIGYDEQFGGKLLTQSIYTILIEKMASALSYDENNELPPRTAARLMEAAEKAKVILSANADYHVNLEAILNDHDFKAVITREEFEEINIDYMARVTKPITDALHGTEVSINDLEAVILTGGSSRVPFIQKHLSTFVGDDRISKTVNADESCAVGTTVKAFRLKTQFGSHKDFEIIDKCYHNYEINVNDEEQTIFLRGTPTDSSKKINFGELTDDISIQLYEDGGLLKTYNIEKVLEKTSSLTCNKDPKYKKQLFGHFVLDSNKVFSLGKLEAECIKEGKDGFFKKFLNKDGEEEVEEEVAEEEVSEQSKDDTETASESEKPANASATAKARTPKKVLRPVPIGLPRPQFASIKQMSRPLKERISAKLDYLDSRDDMKEHLESIKNQLEAACYELRNLVEDKEDAISEELSADDLRSEVSDTIEWLEFESDGSSVEEFEDKIKQIQARKDEINSIIKMSDTDLSFTGLQKLYEDGNSILMKMQTRLLEFGGDISNIRKKYQEHDLDFDKENERVKAQMMAKGDDKMMRLETTLQSYKDMLSDLGEIISGGEKGYSKHTKADLFKKYEAITDGIVSMLADVLMVDQSHQDRMKGFNSKFDKLLERRQQKEFREKLKQEKAEEKAKLEAEAEVEPETEENINEEPNTNEDLNTNQDPNVETNQDNQENLEHDEL